MSLIIKVSTSLPELSSILLRQTHLSSGTWENCQFFVNELVKQCDWWVICHCSALKQPESTICDPTHVVFISMEPTEGVTPQAFYNQFSKLVLCDRRIKHPDITYKNGITWWVGINVQFDNGHIFSPVISHDYDSLKSMALPNKLNRISVICSNNKSLSGHVKRLDFLEKLKVHPIGQHVDFFGGGHNPILDKFDAIAPYKYHLVLENSVVPDYWSEKLSDSFLCFSLPIYYGCQNIERYFSGNSLIQINIENFDESIKILEVLIYNDLYNNYLPNILLARDLVLHRYNIFQLMSNICNRSASKYVKCIIKPVSLFAPNWPIRAAKRIIRQINKIFTN